MCLMKDSLTCLQNGSYGMVWETWEIKVYRCTRVRFLLGNTSTCKDVYLYGYVFKISKSIIICICLKKLLSIIISLEKWVSLVIGFCYKATFRGWDVCMW